MKTIKLKNCKLSDNKIADILIKDGKIEEIGLSKKADTEIDIKNNLIIPGVIDLHVHFREPGGSHKEDWLTGSCSAAAGGVTTVVDMPNTSPPTIDESTLNEKRKLAEKSLINFGFYLGATANNHGQIKNIKNVAGVKIFAGSSTGDLLVDHDEDIENLFKVPNIKWAVHAEDEEIIKTNKKNIKEGESNPAIHSLIRSREAASRAVERIISLAEKTGANVRICHVSTKEELDLIREAKKAGIKITCEASPHHIFLNETKYKSAGNFAKVNPPLRTPGDNNAVWEALLDGTIDVIATDHAPHSIEEKSKEYPDAPAGLPEIQTSLPLLLNELNKKKYYFEKIDRDNFCHSRQTDRPEKQRQNRKRI
ncbi:MAG: dihydroorotase [Patescibacteria group bacterium]